MTYHLSTWDPVDEECCRMEWHTRETGLTQFAIRRALRKWRQWYSDVSILVERETA